MIFNSNSGSCNSRQGKPFDIIKQTQLYRELKRIQEHVILDGELYVHNGVFENLGILRKKRLSEADKQNLEMIEYHVYDIVLNDCPFTDRLNILTKLINSGNFTKIKLVKTVEVNNEESMKEYHCNFVKDNYEGSILRNKHGLYKCKIRSTDLLKYKDFEDDEFEIVDYTCEIDTSKEDLNLIVWICKTKNGDQFNVRPGGTKLERQNLYKICKVDFKYMGKKLCVKYFELTERGIPRFPATKTTSVNSYIREIIE
jgi:DNA ligase-1